MSFLPRFLIACAAVALVSAAPDGAAARRKELTPLQKRFVEAQRVKDYEAVRRLLNEGLDPDGKIPALGMTPMALAVMKGDAPLIGLLVEGGADVGQEDYLAMAVLGGEVGSAEELLRAGATVTEQARAYAALKAYGGDSHFLEIIGAAGTGKGAVEAASAAPSMDLAAFADGATIPTGLFSGPCSADARDAPAKDTKQGDTGYAKATTTVVKPGHVDLPPLTTDVARGIAGVSGAMATLTADAFTISKSSDCRPVELGEGDYTVVTYVMEDQWTWECSYEASPEDCKFVRSRSNPGYPTVQRDYRHITVASEGAGGKKPGRKKPRIKIITPVSGDQFPFDTTFPGKVVIDVEADVQPASLSPSVLWTMKSAKPVSGNPARIIIDRLPAGNSEFGTVRITASAGGQSDSVDVDLFFNPTAKNHGGGGHKVTPNWFHYWMQTKAGGKLAAAHAPGRVATDGSNPVGQYDYFTDQVFLTDRIMQTSCLPRVAMASGGSKGIDCFAETIRHETRHKKERWLWWGALNPLQLKRDDLGAYMTLDFDGDLVPTSIERGLAASRNCSWLFSNSCDGRPYAHLLDTEMNAYWVGWEWYVSAADSEDWSMCGKQWNDLAACPKGRRW